MKTSRQWLAEVKAARNIPSDYALAKALRITKSGVSQLQAGKVYLSDDTAVAVAELLDIDPAEVMLSAHFEREKSGPVRAVWEQLFRRLGGAAVVVAAIGGGSLPAPAEAAAKPASEPAVCIMSNRRRPRKSSLFQTATAMLEAIFPAPRPAS